MTLTERALAPTASPCGSAPHPLYCHYQPLFYLSDTSDYGSLIMVGNAGIDENHDWYKHDKNRNASDGKKNKTTGGRGGGKGGGGGGGKRDRRDHHIYLLWYNTVGDEANAIYKTMDHLFLTSKTNKSKTNTTTTTMIMTTENVDCNHEVIQGNSPFKSSTILVRVPGLKQPGPLCDLWNFSSS